MKEKPVLAEHYGEMVWVNPLAENLRREECLCYNCKKYHPDEKGNCPISEKLFKIAKKEHLAMIVTRCPAFGQK